MQSKRNFRAALPWLLTTALVGCTASIEGTAPGARRRRRQRRSPSGSGRRRVPTRRAALRQGGGGGAAMAARLTGLDG